MDLVNLFVESLKPPPGSMNSLTTAASEDMFARVDQLVKDFIARSADGPDLSRCSELCRLINQKQISGRHAIRATQSRIIVKDGNVQLLALTLLESFVRNCKTIIPDVASERVLNEIVNLVEDHQAPVPNREKAIKLLKEWAEHAQAPPIFAETYKRLIAKGCRLDGTASEIPLSKPTLGISSKVIADAHGKGTYIKQDAQNRIQGLLKELTASPEDEAHHASKKSLVEELELIELCLYVVRKQAFWASFFFEARHSSRLSSSKLVSGKNSFSCGPWCFEIFLCLISILPSTLGSQ